jgi:hypothetical protein
VAAVEAAVRILPVAAAVLAAARVDTLAAALVALWEHQVVPALQTMELPMVGEEGVGGYYRDQQSPDHA